MFLAGGVVDTYILYLSLFVVLVILFGLLLKYLKQPYIISYILVGMLIGPQGFGLIDNAVTVTHLGEIGIILLLFFIGMEISLAEFIKQWRTALIGTSLQISFSVLIILGIGYTLGWDKIQSIIIGFVIALSSSAVIIKLLGERGLLNTRVGKNVLSILLTQDIVIVPLLIITSFLGGRDPEPLDLFIMIAGGIGITLLLIFLYSRKNISLPFSKYIIRDHELQVFVALLLCFGGAMVSSLLGLSPALGAFIGGIIMHMAKATQWIHNTLHSFRILFVAIFFIDIGLQLDIQFLQENATALGLVVLAVYFTNHFLNTLILRVFKCSWREAWLGGAYLAQIGELSFLISSAAYGLAILSTYSYKFTITLISLTLIISPFWIGLAEYFLKLEVRKKSDKPVTIK